MITIIKQENSVLIKDGQTSIVFPLNSFIVRKSGDREISLISTISSDRFKDDIANFVPRVTENFKTEIPTEQESLHYEKNSIWHSKKTGMFYLHDGETFKVKSTEKIVELFMLRLANMLNGK